MRNAFRHIPDELVEAALVDGASYARIFWSIVLPLSLPIISTVAIITFVASWNNYLLPLVVLDTQNKYPWPLGLMQFQSLYSTDWPKVLTYITITISPAVGMFLLAQKYIVAGLTAGAVKA
jgi:raffinose/stachyose/melibiose transport system permease protein